ncbi:hypothetical protein [Xanthomonas translucens]|nr:hypothetical protein [Xanthomonas translucens]
MRIEKPAMPPSRLISEGGGLLQAIVLAVAVGLLAVSPVLTKLLP